MSKLESNIWKLYVFNFLDMFAVFLPFIVYHFQRLGFSLANIAIFGTAMSITLLVFEIPSGYFADRFGRKTSLITSIILQIVSMYLLYVAVDFKMLILSHVLAGLGITFLSGADSALLYDTLLELKREKEYKRIDGRSKFYAEIAVILSALIGTVVVARFDLLYTVLLTILSHTVLLLISLLLVEPKSHRPIEKLSFGKEFEQLVDIVKRSVYDKRLLGLFLYMFIVSGVSNTIFMMYQPYFSATGLKVEYFGLIFVFFSVFTAITAFKVHDIEAKLGVYWSLILIPLFLVFSSIFAGLFFVWFGFIFFVAREIVRGFVYPVLGDYTNRIVKSEERATVLSIGSMFSRLGYSIIILMFGFFADLYGMRIVYLWMGVILLIVILFVANLLRVKSKVSRSL